MVSMTKKEFMDQLTYVNANEFEESSDRQYPFSQNQTPHQMNQYVPHSHLQPHILNSGYTQQYQYPLAMTQPDPTSFVAYAPGQAQMPYRNRKNANLNKIPGPGSKPVTTGRVGKRQTAQPSSAQKKIVALSMGQQSVLMPNPLEEQSFQNRPSPSLSTATTVIEDPTLDKVFIGELFKTVKHLISTEARHSRRETRDMETRMSTISKMQFTDINDRLGEIDRSTTTLIRQLHKLRTELGSVDEGEEEEMGEEAGEDQD